MSTRYFYPNGRRIRRDELQPRPRINPMWQVVLRADGIQLVDERLNLSIFFTKPQIARTCYNEVANTLSDECLVEPRPGECAVVAEMVMTRIDPRPNEFIAVHFIQRYPTAQHRDVPRWIGLRTFDPIFVFKRLMKYEEDEPVFLDVQFIPEVYEISSDDTGDILSEDQA